MDGVDKWEGFGIGVQEHKVSEKWCSSKEGWVYGWKGGKDLRAA